MEENEVEVIKIPPKKVGKPEKLRVAVYARVSADKDSAYHSLMAQDEYGAEFVNAHPNWELVGVYSDNARSGTLRKRPAFQRMMEDCRARKIDLVVTKSVSRLARNSALLMETLGELERLGIDCYFELDHRYASDFGAKSWIKLTGIYAEGVAEEYSDLQIRRIDELYKQGKPSGGHDFGYRFNKDKFIIFPKEARVVKKIYELYLEGMGYGRIAKYLNSLKVAAPHGGTWNESSIRDILTNKFYNGVLTLQRTFRNNFLDKELVRNTGEMRMVVVENAHEAIIDDEMFKKVQNKIKRKGAKQMIIMQNKKHEDEVRLFTGMIQCSKCGSTFIRKRPNKGSNKPFWVCGKYFKQGKAACPSHKISEEILIVETAKALMTTKLTPELIKNKIEKIYVPEKDSLVFSLKDGSKVYAMWRDMTRNEKGENHEK